MEYSADKVSAKEVFKSQVSCQKSVILPSPTVGNVPRQFFLRDAGNEGVFLGSCQHIRVLPEDPGLPRQHRRVVEFVHKLEKKTMVLCSELPDAKTSVLFRSTNSFPSQQAMHSAFDIYYSTP